eukprot:2405998-Heterocapsa_arctica.AAC.1
MSSTYYCHGVQTLTPNSTRSPKTTKISTEGSGGEDHERRAEDDGKIRHSEKLMWSCAKTLRQMCLRVAALLGEDAMAYGQTNDALIYNSTQIAVT